MCENGAADISPRIPAATLRKFYSFIIGCNTHFAPFLLQSRLSYLEFPTLAQQSYRNNCYFCTKSNFTRLYLYFLY